MGFLDRLRGKPDVKSLRERGDVEELVKALSHKEWTVRSEAAEALGELGDRRAVAALIGALEDKYWGVCKNAIKALVMFKDPDSVTSLLRVLQDPSSDRGKRSNVAAALEQIKDPRAVQPLSLVLETTPGAARALADALIERGASVILSWDKGVTAPYMDAATVILLRKLLVSRESMAQAVEETMGVVGPDPSEESILHYYPANKGSYTLWTIIATSTS